MALAARGARNMDHGLERVTDPAELAALRRQTALVYLKSVAFAVLLTAFCFLFPA